MPTNNGLNGRELSLQPVRVVIWVADLVRRSPKSLRQFQIEVVADLSPVDSASIPDDLTPVHVAVLYLNGFTEALQRSAMNHFKEQGISVLAMIPATNPESLAAARFSECLDWGADGVLPVEVEEASLAAAILSICHQASILRQSQEQVVALQTKIEQNKTIACATAVIAKQLNVSETEALRNLRNEARNRRRPMHELAAIVLQAHEIISPVSASRKSALDGEGSKS